MKILVTGSNGLLGQKLLHKLRIDKSVELIATSKGNNRITIKEGYTYLSLDVTNNIQVEEIIFSEKPDIIINSSGVLGSNVDLDKDVFNTNFGSNCEIIKYYLQRKKSSYNTSKNYNFCNRNNKYSPTNYFGFSYACISGTNHLLL